MLLTKLHIPAASYGVVPRPLLLERLNTGLSRKLILISAPAGFGKTTLLSNWISTQAIPTAWFSIDKADNDPVDFLSYVISGIQGVSKEFGEGALKLLKSPTTPSVESTINMLINDILTIKENFLLVLDDFHLIHNIEILKLVTYLLEHIPENIHIVILTRSDPALPIARLRSQHQLLELRSQDLCFSANDISILFNKKLRIGLSIDDIRLLEAKTEGWIAGLQLTALSMQGREDISLFIQNLKGDNRYIMDYLIEEVLRAQTDDTKEFLLQTSILEQLSAPLCNAVLGRNDSQQILENLERNNMFLIPLDDEREWYRYHHLFADLLKQRLMQRSEASITELHARASEWFHSSSMPLLAIEHTLVTGNYVRSIQLIGEVVESMWINGQHSAILKYGELLPEETIRTSPEFCLYYSWILIMAGQIPKATPYLKSAEAIIKRRIKAENLTEEALQSKKLMGKISVAFAFLNSLYTTTTESSEHCKTAMEYLSDDDPLWRSWGWFSIGATETACENFSESIVAYEKALEYGKRSGNIFLISNIAMNLAYLESRMGLYTASYRKCSDLIDFMRERGYSQLVESECSFASVYSCMAGIQAMRNDIDGALDNIKIAYKLSQNESNSSFRLVVILVYSLILYSRGDSNGVKEMLNEAEGIVKSNVISPGALAIYVAMKGTNLIERNEIERAKEFFREYGVEAGKKISYVEDRGYFPYTVLLLLESRFNEAELVLNQLQAMAEAANRIETLIDVKILYAILNKITGNGAKAVECLADSVRLAATEGIIMPFVFYYAFIKEELDELYNEAMGDRSIPKQLIGGIKQAVERREKHSKIFAEAGLSARELDTLRLIAEDLSNQEIADKLFVSLNTVKTHLKSIYLKLDVDSRTKAVSRARGMGLV